MGNAAQLIAQIRVTGVPQFVAGTKQAEAGMERVAGSARSAGGALMGFTKTLGVVGGSLLAVGAAAAGFAVKSALEFDTAQRKLEAFLGSADEAKRTMQFIQNLAAPSLFETADLAKAGTLLAAYGLNIERVLPLVDKLASAMGEGAESVSEVARVFGRLKSGDFGEAFERLRDFGISFDDLRAKGLEFSKSNEYLGDRLQALTAVSQIVEERFGKISQVMQNSPAAKFASGMDAIRKTAVQVGAVLLGRLAPAVETVSNWLNFLAGNRVFEKITRNLLFVFNAGNTNDALPRALAYITVLLQRIPQAILKVRGAFETGFSYAQTLMKPVAAVLGFIAGARLVTGLIAVSQAVIGLAKAIRTLGVAGAIAQAVGGGLKGIAALAGGIIAATAAVAGINALFDQNGIGKALEGITGGLTGSDVGKDVDEMLKQFNRTGGGFGSAMEGMATATAASAMGFTRDDTSLRSGQSAAAPQQEGGGWPTIPGTRMPARMPDNGGYRDITRHALGGGSLGSMGITATEFASVGAGMGGRSKGNTVTVEIKNAKTLEEVLQDAMQQVLTQYDRMKSVQR